MLFNFTDGSNNLGFDGERTEHFFLKLYFFQDGAQDGVGKLGGGAKTMNLYF